MLQTPEQKIEIAFRRRIEECAKPADAATALGVYAEMKAANVARPPYLYRVLINICSSCADSSAFRAQAFQVYEDMKQDGHEKAIDESTYSALIKICSKDHDFAASRELIAALEERSVSPKLRTFAPLLAAYSEKGELENCLWVRARLAAHDIEPTEPDFVALLRACVKAGDATQFYTTLDEYIDCVEKPGADGWAVLKEWFARYTRSLLAGSTSPGSRSLCLCCCVVTPPRWTARRGRAASAQWTQRACAP